MKILENLKEQTFTRLQVDISPRVIDPAHAHLLV
jgi:hypothetical protein